VPGNEAFPLQFFTTYYHNQINYRLSKQAPHTKGLFTAGIGDIQIWADHFDLDCRGMYDEDES